MKVCYADTGSWEWDIVMIEGGKPDEITTYVTALGLKDIYLGDELGHTWLQPNLPVAIWLHDHKDIPSLVHEIIPGVFGILESRGLKHCMEAEEAYTYTVGYVLKQCLKDRDWRRV